MSMVTTKDGVQIFYKDWGHGQPIVFHHGWPLSCDDWDTQMLFFLQKGYRVTAFGKAWPPIALSFTAISRPQCSTGLTDREPSQWTVLLGIRGARA